MAFERAAGICRNYDKNRSDRQSTCYQRVLRFQVSLEKIFSNSTCLDLMENCNESAALLIWVVFVTREHVDSPNVF